MIQETSRTAYWDTQATSIEQREKVRQMYEKYGASTDKEIQFYTGIPANLVSARRNELIKQGKVRKWDQRKCKSTGRKVIAWELRPEEPQQSSLL